MTSLSNLRRDMKWVGEPAVVAPVAGTLSPLDVGTDGTMGVRHGYVHLEPGKLPGSPDTYHAIGLWLQWSRVGPTPFRVKGSSRLPCFFGFGWGQPSSSEIANPRFCHFGDTLDDVWCVREMVGYSDEHLCFFLGIPSDASVESFADLSVHNLLYRADQYSSRNS